MGVFPYFCVKSYVVGNHQDHLIETIAMSAHIIVFGYFFKLLLIMLSLYCNLINLTVEHLEWHAIIYLSVN